MLFGLHETTEPLRVVAIFAGFKYGHVTVRYSPQRDLWAMPRHRMAPPGGLSVLPGPVLAGGESSEWATRITLIPRFQTPHEPSQPQSQNRTLRNASASDRKGPTPRKDEHTGNNTVTNAIPRIVYRKCVTQEPFPFKVGYSHKQMTLVHTARQRLPRRHIISFAWYHTTTRKRQPLVRLFRPRELLAADPQPLSAASRPR